MSLSPAELQARLSALRDAELKLLTGERITRVAYDGGTVEYASGATVADIRRAIVETERLLAIATGARRGGRFVPVLGG